MHGNVLEWCNDLYADYPDEDSIDPQGPDEGYTKFFLSVSCFESPSELRSAYRGHQPPYERFIVLGFRLAMTITTK